VRSCFGEGSGWIKPVGRVGEAKALVEMQPTDEATRGFHSAAASPTVGKALPAWWVSRLVLVPVLVAIERVE